MYKKYLSNIRSKGKRSFTIDQLVTDLKVSYDSAKSGLYRLRKEKKIISPAKGLYIILPPEYLLQGSIPGQELVPILMNHLKIDYYVSLLSAASYHGASHQKPGSFQIITNKLIKHPLEFGNIKLEIIYKKSFDELPHQDITVNTGYLRIATPELVALDLLLYPGHSGGLNHIATVLSELIEAIDANKLITLAQIVKEKVWLQRLGFILENIETMNEKKQNNLINKIKDYLSDKMKRFMPLEASIPITGHPRNKKWYIIENTNIESDL